MSGQQQQGQAQLAAILGIAACVSGALIACGPPPPAMVAKVDPPTATPVAPSAAPVGADYSKLPAPGPLKPWSPPPPVSYQLSNGIQVLHVKQGTAPLVSVQLVLSLGSATDPVGKAGATSLMADMLDEGAAGLTALQLDDAWQRLGADYDDSVSVDFTILSVDVLTQHFPASMKLLADVVRKPTFSRVEFKRLQQERLAHALTEEAAPPFGRRMALRRALYGRGYLGELPNGKRSTLQKLSHADMLAQYRALVAPNVATFVVVGNVDEAAVKAALEPVFGDWKGAATAKPAALEPQAAAPSLVLVDYPGAAQSSIALVRRAEKADGPEHFPGMVFNRSFGGFFTSRVNLNLREDKGYTYGASSNFDRYRDAGLYFVAADVKSETTRASIDEVYKELQLVCGSKPLTAQERADAVGGLLEGQPNRFETNGAVAGQLTELSIYKRPLDWFTTWPKQVDSVTLPQAQAIAKAYCDPTQYTVVVSGDLKAVGPSLESLPLPKLLLDKEGEPVTAAVSAPTKVNATTPGPAPTKPKAPAKTK